MSIPEDVAQQLMLTQKRAQELESELQDRDELVYDKQRQIDKLNMELQHAMGGAHSGQMLELKALRRALCAVITKYAKGHAVITRFELMDRGDMVINIEEDFDAGKTHFIVNSFRQEEILEALAEKLRETAKLVQNSMTNSPLPPTSSSTASTFRFWKKARP